ncbi:MAG: single-stranded-DNA-specific exonuclease RecJ [Candidatus Eisenbacteria bacterium]
MNPGWTYREGPSADEERGLGEALGLPPLVARLLWSRGIRTSEEGDRFLRPSISHMNDPYRLSDMERAVERIGAALKKGERIGLFGDFDVDGVSGAALLYRFFRRLGRDVSWRLPRRLSEGYDLSREAIEDLAAEGVRLLVTIDCGITAHESVAFAVSRGMDVIVTDHHQPKDTLPVATAVVNPKRSDCPYPFDDLAGVGLAFKLADALSAAGHGEREDLLLDLDLVAVGTIGDVAPLVGENRVLVRAGLTRLAESNKIGLRRLLEVAGFGKKRLDYDSVAFGIGPRINAAGRLGDADPAFELMTTESDGRAVELSTLLDRINQERKALDERILEEALGALDEERGAVVLASRDWHPGVIGIVASRVKERTGTPAVLISVENGVGRGSARGVSGFALHEAFEACSDLLLRHGGHALAAGLTIEEKKIPLFRERFRALFEEERENVTLPGSLTVDGDVPFEACDRNLLETLDRLEPFGPGNQRPILVSKLLRTVGGLRPVGKNHLKFRVGRNGRSIDAIAFRAGHEKAGEWGRWDRIDVAYSLEENTWGGESRLRLNVKGMRLATTGP